MSTEYGKRLSDARIAAGLTQQGLSSKTGIAQSTISTAERLGKGSAETPLYAQATGVSALWLATGQGPRKESGHVPAAPLQPMVPPEARALIRLVEAIPVQARQQALLRATQVLIDFLVPASETATQEPTASESPASKPG